MDHKVEKGGAIDLREPAGGCHGTFMVPAKGRLQGRNDGAGLFLARKKVDYRGPASKNVIFLF
jgi:hypothetical protein